MAQGILDNGEDSIFLSDSKFNEFMKNIEEIAEPTTQTEFNPTVISTEEQLENKELSFTNESNENLKIVSSELAEIEDVESNIEFLQTDEKEYDASELDATTLITQGINFIGGLAKILSSPEATGKLVSSLVEKDKETGKTYMKIPIENEKTITDTLNLLGQLFKGLAK